MKLNKIIVKTLKKLNFLKFFNIETKIKVNSNDVIIPIFEEIGYSNINLSEKWMTDLLKILISIKKTKFIDVGANIGQTLIKVKSIDPNLDYIGFEPNPSCVHYLSKLISLNQFDNAHVLPIALSTEDEILELDHYNEDVVDSSASIIDDFRPSNKVFRKSYIASMSINDKSFLQLIKNCSIIKIDVEGSELEVLKSLYEILETYKPIVIIEILPNYSVKNKDRIQRQEQIFSILKNLSFMIFRVLKSNNDFRGLKEINEIEIHNDLELCDYVLVHESLKENIYNDFDLSI